MDYYGSLSVKPDLPAEISQLKELAYNLWWCWNHEAEELFASIDQELWKSIERNPVKLLATVDHDRLQELVSDSEFMNKYERVMNNFQNYLNDDDTWFDQNFSYSRDEEVIAYFSTEFGFHESLPIYSGGLGVLAGDHCKSASDLGLPLVGVGLLYHNGYFRQKINDEGWQKALYPELEKDHLPIKPAQDKNGDNLKVKVNLLNREVVIKVWKLKVGRVEVYLLDTDLEENSEHDRELTSKLYGGGDETRISQEIILGIGGTKALSAMGYEPSVWHMNEGHSVYLGLERIKKLMNKYALEFEQALEAVAGSTVFTTHTPVPAGNETFSFDLKEKYFRGYWEKLGLSRDQFMDLGCVYEEGIDDEFGLTVLALRLARFSNGVSKLHGEVASEMWEDIWDKVPTWENPITSITNGIHTLTWLAPEWQELFDQYLSDDWRNRIEDQQVWEQVRDIPDEEFWNVHYKLKEKLIEHIRERDLARRKRYNNLALKNEELLDKDKLTIGFARRFATYKRATLIFRDIERLAKICNREGQEVQLVFAGKAHPADVPGQELIKKIHDISQREEFKGKVIILEDYDMNLARYLVQGVDIWLNNPRRPLEASGTSGQKVAANGGLNFSVLDGWWVEGYNGNNGWSIGYEIEYENQEKQDRVDSKSLYKVLEEEIVPLYYKVEDGVAKEWIKRMKEAMVTCTGEYSTDRMVQDYANQLYIPALERGVELEADEFKKAKELVVWKNKLEEKWPELNLKSEEYGDQGDFSIDEKVEFTTQLELSELGPEDVEVELYLVKPEEDVTPEIHIMNLEESSEGVYTYSLELDLEDLGDTGKYKYTFRAVPDADKLSTKHELGLVEWI